MGSGPDLATISDLHRLLRNGSIHDGIQKRMRRWCYNCPSIAFFSTVRNRDPSLVTARQVFEIRSSRMWKTSCETFKYTLVSWWFVGQSKLLARVFLYRAERITVQLWQDYLRAEYRLSTIRHMLSKRGSLRQSPFLLLITLDLTLSSPNLVCTTEMERPTRPRTCN